MAHKQSKTLVAQLNENLQARLKIGCSRHADKRAGVDTRKYIYSYGSLHTYSKQGAYFCRWVRKKYRCKTLQEARKYADEWLAEGIQKNLSAFTLKLYVATLSKIYDESSDAFIPTPARHRKDITKSRRPDTTNDKNINKENYAFMIRFLEATGVRKSEARALRKSALVQDEDGTYRILLNSATKGGRIRRALIVSDVDEIVAKMQEGDPNEKLFKSVPASLDVHDCRSTYAARVYAYYLDKVGPANTRHDRYVCRADMRKKVFSRRLLKLTSMELGHSRENIIPQSYCHKITNGGY